MTVETAYGLSCRVTHARLLLIKPVRATEVVLGRHVIPHKPTG